MHNCISEFADSMEFIGTVASVRDKDNAVIDALLISVDGTRENISCMIPSHSG